MSHYEKLKLRNGSVVYKRVELFSEHSRDGEIIDEAKLKRIANRANMQAEVGHYYYMTKTHDGDDAVGKMRNYTVGRADVVIGDHLVRNCPTLFADITFNQSTAAEIESGKWPRRSCYAEIRDGHLISCSLLGVHEDSWFGYRDLGGERYSAVVAKARDFSYAMYSRIYTKEEKMDPTEKENAAAKPGPGVEEELDAGVDAGVDAGEVPDDVAAEVEPEVAPDASAMDPEEKRLKILERKIDIVLKLLEKVDGGAPGEPDLPPDGTPPEEGATGEPDLPPDASMDVDEEVTEYCKTSKAGYTASLESAVKAVKASGKNLDLKRVRASHLKLYTKHGPAAAAAFVTSLIEATPDAPGTGTRDEISAKQDAINLSKQYTAIQEKVMEAVAVKYGKEEVSRRKREYHDYAKQYHAENDNEDLFVSFEDWIRTRPSRELRDEQLRRSRRQSLVR